MLRDNLAGLIEPMRAARELNPLALFTEQKKSSDDRPQDALKIPAPKGRNLTLTENAASPFHAEPRQFYFGTTILTVPSPLQNRQRSPSMSFPEPAHSTHLATIWNSALAESGTPPEFAFTTSAR